MNKLPFGVLRLVSCLTASRQEANGRRTKASIKNLILFFSQLDIGFLHLRPVKRLVIIRHAKSSWANALLEDFDRPLNERGKKDAPLMAKKLKEKKVMPDIMITSPAKRALSTCKKFAAVFDLDKKKIWKEPKLYHASENTILKISKEIDEKYNVVFLFGHNPGLTNFVNYSSNLEIDNIPTTGVTVLEVSSWKKLGKEKAKAVYFDYPSNIK